MTKRGRRRKRGKARLVLVAFAAGLVACLAGWAVWYVAHSAPISRHEVPEKLTTPVAQEEISPAERRLLGEVIGERNGRSAR